MMRYDESVRQYLLNSHFLIKLFFYNCKKHGIEYVIWLLCALYAIYIGFDWIGAKPNYSTQLEYVLFLVWILWWCIRFEGHICCTWESPNLIGMFVLRNRVVIVSIDFLFAFTRQMLTKTNQTEFGLFHWFNEKGIFLRWLNDGVTVYDLHKNS